MLGTFLSLIRISNLPTVWSNLIAASILVAGSQVVDGDPFSWSNIDYGALPWLLLAGSLFYSGGMILNDVFDFLFDCEHRPERPIPSGKISKEYALILALLLMAGGYFICLKLRCPLLVPEALLICIFLYNYFHKKWTKLPLLVISIALMASCRLLLYLLPALREITVLSAAPIPAPLLAAAIGTALYVAGITLCAREEHQPNSKLKKRSHLLLLISPLLIACIPWKEQELWGFLSFLALSIAFLCWVAHSMGYLFNKPKKISSSNVTTAHIGKLLAGIVLVDALHIAPTTPLFATLLAATLFPILLWQKKIAAS